MGSPISIDYDKLSSSYNWTMHADRFKPELERVMFDIDGGSDTLERHLLAVTDTDALKHVLVTARAQLEAICEEELAGLSPEEAPSLRSWNSNYMRYYDGFADALLIKACRDLPANERPKLSDGRSI